VDRKDFLQAYNLLNTGLVNQVMDRTYNSVGSNVFFEFGRQKEVVFQNGKKHLQKEWCIWLSWTSWRILQYNRYVIGSAESPEISIQPYIERLLGKRLLSFRFLSPFLDIEVVFEDGYQITTFFNYIEENQWLVFLPNATELVVDCSSQEAIESIQHLSEQVKIESQYKELNLPLLDVKVKEVLFNDNEVSQLIFTNSFFN
jgi:hypothetical protein